MREVVGWAGANTEGVMHHYVDPRAWPPIIFF